MRWLKFGYQYSKVEDTMRSSSNVYNISVVANTTARNQLCAVLNVDIHEINRQLEERDVANINCVVDIGRNGSALPYRLHLNFYNPETLGNSFLDAPGMDVCIFAISMNETENPELIQACSEHIMLTEQKIGVQIFGSTESTKPLECFEDFIPDNTFTLQMREPNNDFLEKLILRLEALRKETRQLFASYQEFSSRASEPEPISNTAMENYSALSRFFNSLPQLGGGGSETESLLDAIELRDSPRNSM